MEYQELKTKETLRLPPWLKRPLPRVHQFASTESLLDDLHLATVCQGAFCPNRGECFSAGIATFMILGSQCTRNCRFCNISPGRPGVPDPDEPTRVAEAALRLQLQHVVVTSVTRDDLPDGGSAHFAATIRAIREVLPKSSVEVLIPDFRGDEAALNTVLDAGPDVLNHNVETHPDLYFRARPQADYEQSLELLRRVHRRGIISKSGFMVGLGENDDQVSNLLRDLKACQCTIVTIGQYMRPSREHLPVDRYVHPDDFERFAQEGRNMGISYVYSGPLVRSSYMAGEVLADLKKRRREFA